MTKRGKTRFPVHASQGAAGPCVSLVTGQVVERIEEQAAHPPHGAPSPAEIAARATGAGGWTRATLAEWGVPWPPPKGWRVHLERAYAAQPRTQAHRVDASERLRQRDLPLPAQPDTQ
jgi:hypothetical protein